MSCFPFQNQEPEFEPVTLRHPIMEPFMTNTRSSPKLRLSFEHRDSLMTDADFEGIINTDSDQNPDARAASPLLPPSPCATKVYPGILDVGGKAGSSAVGNSKLELPAELQHQLSYLGFNPRGSGTGTGAHNIGWQKSDNADFEAKYFDDKPVIEPLTAAPVAQPKVKGKEKADATAKPKPRPISIIPRVGTLTALPGSTMMIEGVNDESPGPSTNTTMLPPPAPTHHPITGTSFSTSKGQDHSFSRKRKLSISAPFSNIKRILTSAGAKEKPSITHLTHEATAHNRARDGGDGSNTPTASGTGTSSGMANPGNPTTTAPAPPRDLITPIFAGPSSSYPSSPPTPTSTRTCISTPTPSTTRLLANAIFHRRTPTADTVTSTNTNNKPQDPTSKAALNKLIIQLRSQVSDLTLENRVLKDQIAIVRRDWIETSQELDLERHRGWEGEMETFRLRILVEELRTEVGRLKRGSVLN